MLEALETPLVPLIILKGAARSVSKCLAIIYSALVGLWLLIGGIGKMKVLKIGFHDRDGHLICPYPEDVPNWENLTPFQRQAPWFIPSPERQMILPGVKELLAQFDLNFVVSNQNLRLKDEPEENNHAICHKVRKQAQWLMNELPIKAFCCCPDSDGNFLYCYTFSPKFTTWYLNNYYPHLKGTFRKPKTGMVEAIRLGFLQQLTKEGFALELYGFGDRVSDKVAFESADVKFEWSDIARGYPDPSLRND